MGFAGFGGVAWAVFSQQRERERRRRCQHLSHLPSGKCLGCGEQHQPLPDYKPGDDEAWLEEHDG